VNISSFHTHTRLCKHAAGVPADYARQAALDGCSALGFSDHCPYPDDATWSGSRMAVSELPEYRSLVDEVKASSPFPVYFGFECEWHPGFESWYRDEIRGAAGAEFLVYGSHWIGDAGELWYIPEYAKPELLARYVDLTVSGIRSGLYDLFAHPDIFLAGYTRLDADTRAACRDIISASVGMDLPMEINGLGLSRTKIMGDNGLRSPYPVREFWEMAAAAGARIVCNSDAHRPQDVIASARRAWSFAEEIGITPLDPAEALGF
jgi:Histidinol phosphatase and related hydrolases of the PHP family